MILTKTLVVTHAEGFMACFTKEADGTVKQQALVNVGEHAPTALELCLMGDELAERFGWTTAVALGPRVSKQKALPPVKKKRKAGRAGEQRSKVMMEVETRKEEILACIKEHGPMTTAACLTTIFGHEPDQHVAAAWRHQFNALRNEGKIASRGDRPIIWEVCDVPAEV